ncbi:MAG TPA: DeoR family transcriptional regulator [Patescibacteria group bacterium]|nr:DeoR family transcriptional regulator [Patescibacteria group bacterium]
MEERHKKILAAIIEEYTNSAIPVGSKVLVEKYGFDISSATIRNDMQELEEKGFLHQPHISAGRIPTDKGYRFFVEEIMKDQKLTITEQKKLQEEVLKLKAQNSRLSRTTAKLLSSLSGNLAITGQENDFYDFGMSELMSKPEFKSIDEFCRVAEVLDYIDENIDTILAQVKDNETKIFIGKENPIKEISNCSMVVSPYKTKDGERGVLAIIGPKRMKYAKNKSLLDYVRKLISPAAVIIVVISHL